MKRLSYSIMIVIYTSATVGLSLLFALGVFARFDLMLFDSNYALRSEWNPTVPVLIVAYDDPTDLWVSRNAFELRDVIAETVSLAAESGADCVAVDYAFMRPTKYDLKLKKALLACRSVVIALSKGEGRLGGKVFPVFVDPTPVVAEVLQYEDIWAGVTNVTADRDGVLRRLQTAWFGHPVVGNRVGKAEWRLSFPAAVIAAVLQADEVKIKRKKVIIRSKRRSVTIPRKCMLDFCGPPGTLKRISMVDFLTLRKSDLKGKVVFIGDVRSVAGDVYRVPSSSVDAPWMPGVELLANGFAALYERRWFTELPPFVAWFLFLGTVALCLPAFYLGKRRRIATVGLWAPAMIVLFWLAQYIAFLKLLFLPVTGCMFAVLIQATGGFAWRIAFLWRRERQIVALFGRYVSEKVVHRILSGEVRVDLEGHTKEISVLFADLHDFTPLSERLTAQQTGEVLNRFFARMIGVVFRYDGTLDKLMGDCVMAFFNDPDDQPDHPERACRVALEMMNALSDLKVEGHPLKVGVGINTGTAVVGNLGAPQFYDYTAVGDTVNLANRFQGLTRDYGVGIIVGEATYNAANRLFLFRRLDKVRVKGRYEPIYIFQLVSAWKDADEVTQRFVKKYEEGLAALEKGEFENALTCFEELIKENPNDKPCHIMRENCLNAIHRNQKPPTKTV